MKIDGIGALAGLEKQLGVNPAQQANTKDASKSFGDILQGALGDVNKSQVKAYEAMEGIATGKVDNLQRAVQQIEEAELSLKLGLEVKNKAINSYKEIMKMQV